MLLAQIAIIFAGTMFLVLLATYLSELDGHISKEIRITRYISVGIFAVAILTAAISAAINGINMSL